MGTSNRFKFVAAVAVILERGDGKILLQKRKGAYAAGFHMLPTGHVDGAESIQQAMARELEEETGIVVHPADLTLVHMTQTAYDQTDELITFFFHTNQFSGKLVNREPHKCESMEWVNPEKLPDTFLFHARHVVNQWNRGDECAVTTFPVNPRRNVTELTQELIDRRRNRPAGPAPK
jgi:8-oxo-dGTP pyrophosphatase MutT (NUDIX family)